MSTLERRSTSAAVGLIAPAARGNTATPARLSGYAAVFGDVAEIAGLFRERIARGAFAQAIGRDDCRCLFNHSGNYVLGRTRSDTLRLSEDSRGLRYECDINADDPQAMSVLAMVRRNDVSQSSFAFEVLDEEWERHGSRSELPLRTIKAVRLYDVSPVATPAYESTTVSASSIAAAARAGGPLPSWQGQIEIARQRLRIAAL